MTLEDGWNIIYKNGKIDSAIVVENGRIDGDPEESWTRYGYTFDPAVVLTKAEYDALVAAAPPAMTEGLLDALKMAYRKHHLEDMSIGWEELSDVLHNALCEIMGDKAYQVWLTEAAHD